jgi:peptidoglycan/xylan/chitin deacetylase (PgdA/CDA1 family)
MKKDQKIVKHKKWHGCRRHSLVKRCSFFAHRHRRMILGSLCGFVALIFGATLTFFIIACVNFQIKPEFKNISIQKTASLDANKVKAYQDKIAAEKAAAEVRAIAEAEANAKRSPQVAAIPAGPKTIYLTFDDGPTAYTSQLLDVLDQFGVKATFFVIHGDPSLYQQIANRGHAIGLHSWTHQYSIYTSEETYFNDLNTISNAVEQAVGYAPKIIRFPGGTSNTISRQYSAGIMSRLSNAVHERGYKYYDWNCVTGDAAGSISVASQIANVQSCGQNTVMLLAHDRVGTTVDAMREIIPYFQNRGYTFATISTDTPEIKHSVNN